MEGSARRERRVKEVNVTENTARSIFDVVERLQPSSIVLEQDEQGRPRIIKLQMPPRAPASIVEALDTVSDASPVLAAASSDLNALAERCVAAIDGMIRQHAQNERELARLEPAIRTATGPLYAALAARVDAITRENDALRNGTAAAIRGLVEEFGR